jgi:hypothetical protein
MRTRYLVLAIATVLVAAACGSADEGAGLASADPLIPASTADAGATGEVATLQQDAPTTIAASTAAEEVTVEEAFLAFAECMRGEGIELNDPQFEADGTLRLTIRSLVVGDVDEEVMQSARTECALHLEGVTQTFQMVDRSDLEDQLFAFAQCMRDNGYDIPDPVYVEGAHTPGQGGGGQGGPFGKLDRADPEFIAANDLCLPRFDDLWWGPGGGLGGGGGGEE